MTSSIPIDGELMDVDMRNAEDFDYDDEDEDPSYFDMDSTSFQQFENEIRRETSPRRPLLDIEWSDEEEMDDDLAFEDEMKIFTKGRSSKGRRKVGEPHKLDPEVEQLISHASTAYSRKEYPTAIELCEEALKLDGQAKQALVLLAVIYEEMDDMERALMAKILVMHLDKQNKEGWIEVARLSRDAGQYSQALVFYGRAAKLDDRDWQLRHERAMTYTEAGQHQRALDLLRKIRHTFFSEISDDEIKRKIILDTAQVLDTLGRRDEAINMYEDIFNKSQDPEKNGIPDLKFDWLELNILSELYFKEREFQRAIRAIKRMSRWILGRGKETWWDNIKDDSEFDEYRRVNIPQFNSSEYRSSPEKFVLPIDIRVRLIYCRLKSGQFNEARAHISYLRVLDIEELQDLYYGVGEALEDAGLWEDALDIFQALASVIPNAPPLLAHIAKCLTMRRNIGDADEAENLYEQAIELSQEDDSLLDVRIECLIGLAEIYGATDRTDEAKGLVQEVYQLREYSKELERPSDAVESETNRRTLLLNARSKPSTRRQTREERIESEKRASETTEEQYSKLIRYQDGVDKKNPVSISEWLDAAAILVNMFCSVKKFFPSDRNKLFTGLKTNKSWKEPIDDNIDERLNQLNDRINENDLAETDENENNDISTHFRGISFDNWFNIFMKYALLSAGIDPELSYLVLQSARGANVFHQKENTRNDETIWLVHISCASIADDLPVANEVIRQYLNIHQFSGDAFRLYGAILSSGNMACEFYKSNNNQKFFLRQLKAIDSVISGQKIEGAAKIVSTDQELVTENPLLLVLYGQIMLLGRSYSLCVKYLLRALQSVPNDPLIIFTLGIVYIHRAIQRQTTNRHLQVVDGFSYLLDYYKLQVSKGPAKAQEASYNMARAFHTLGLFTQAIHYYEKVLCFENIDEEYDLRREAAYNLHLIYTVNGNARLARRVVDEYLVI